MTELSQNAGQIFDGLLFGVGILAVYLGAVITGALVRSLAGAGTKGLTVLGRHATGWLDYVRGDDRNTVNVTLNMVVDNHLKFDTIVADRRIFSVWPNAYRVHLIRRAARRTTADNPILSFPQRRAGERHRPAHHRKVRKREGRRERPQPARSADPRGRLSRDLRPADQPDQRTLHQRRFARPGARPSDGRISVRDRADVRAAQFAPRPSSARNGDLGEGAAGASRDDAAGRCRRASHALPHAAGDREAIPRSIPNASAWSRCGGRRASPPRHVRCSAGARHELCRLGGRSHAVAVRTGFDRLGDYRNFIAWRRWPRRSRTT